MCVCTPGIKTQFCGKPGCEWPEQAPKLRIELTGHGRGRVFVGSTEIVGVTKISFSAGFDELTTVIIECRPSTLSVTAAEAILTTVPVEAGDGETNG